MWAVFSKEVSLTVLLSMFILHSGSLVRAVRRERDQRQGVQRESVHGRQTTYDASGTVALLSGR